ncbi:MAG: hypothetical protein M3209_07115 [Acidobacteriota bacterium]|nr:hypothetical protein [Acidobacteriota bacterium]
MAKDGNLKPFEGTKSAKQLRRDWNLTLMTMIVVTLLVLLSLTAALFYGLISPYTTGGDVGP